MESLISFLLLTIFKFCDIFTSWIKPKYTENMSYHSNIVDEFEFIANELAPSKKYLKIGNTVADSVFRVLQDNFYLHGLVIARTVVAGSIGKQTGISYEDDDGSTRNPDFDCVIYVNDMKPPFDNVLVAMKRILKQHPKIYNIRTSRYCVQFDYDTNTSEGIISFDLLPAMNCVKHVDENALRHNDVGNIQASRALQRLTKIQTKSINEVYKISKPHNRLWSSSFAEKTVALIGDPVSNNEFHRKVIRIAKFWCAKIFANKNQYVSAKSYMIEIIAIYAQRRRNKRCVVFGFKRFLEMMQNFGTLYVTLCDKKIIAEFDYIRPVIVDPANPFNNLADGIDENAISTFETQASLTLDLLNNLQQHANNNSYSDKFEGMIECLFEYKN